MKYKRIVNMWHNMKSRCYSAYRKDYKYYGGKGVEVCDEWINDYFAFQNWALNNGYEDNLTIDRIDSNGNYEPSNCRFITLEEQQRNKCNNLNFTLNGKTQTLSEWGREYGINSATLKDRLNLGYPFEEAINKKDGILKTSRLYEYEGQVKTLTQWANYYGMSKNCLFERFKRGWSLERSLKTPVKRRNVI